MDFYYDRVLKSDYATYRVWGQRRNDEQPEKLTDPKCIIRDIIREPLSLTVNHNFAYAPSSSIESLTVIRQNWETFKGQVGINVQEATNSIANFFSQFTGSDLTIPAQRFLQVIPPTDFFKVFEGTKIELSLNFRVRLYKRRSDSDSNAYISPVNQLTEINKYFIGYSWYTNMYGEDITTSETNKNPSYLIYAPPHGYKGLMSQGWEPEGTLTLFYGKNLKIENLLLQSYNFTFSRETLPGDEGPLYIDLTFSLIPAILFTVKDVESITSGVGSGTNTEETT